MHQFTEVEFEGIVRQLVDTGYRFARYGETNDDRHVLFRHDIDFSPQRAAKLSAIEKRNGAFATYFVNLRSPFYSVLDPNTSRALRTVVDNGHELGIHFDAEGIGGRTWTREQLLSAIDREARLFEMVFGVRPRAMSWHNPDRTNVREFDDTTVGELVSAYAPVISQNYTYCSDSNGFWRYTPMPDVIAAGHQRLHLLTHPEWWTPTPLSERDRMDRCFLGRARANRDELAAFMRDTGRKDLPEQTGEQLSFVDEFGATFSR